MAAKTKCTMEHRTLIYPRGVFSPEDWMSFVQLPQFMKHWRNLKLNDDDLRSLEMQIMVDPKAAPVIPGTGGLRKLRAVPQGWSQGKRGALRVCYVYFDEVFIVVLVAAYKKGQQDDFSAGEKAAIRRLIPLLKEQFSRERQKLE